MDIEQQLEVRLAKAPVLPLVGGNDPAVAVKTANALNAGGLGVIDVVLRTDEAVSLASAARP